MKPKFGSNVLCTSPASTPARAASRPESTHVARTTRPVSIPATAASARSSATARIVRPSGREREQQADEDDRDDRDDDRDRLGAREPHRAEGVDLERVDVEGARLRTPGEEDRLAEDEREPDRREEHAHEVRAPRAQGTPQREVEADRERSGRDHRRGGRDDHSEPKGRVECDRDERPEGHQVAVGEVDDPEDPVDERDPHGRDRIHGAGDQAVREELEEHGPTMTDRPVAGKRERSLNDDGGRAPLRADVC